MKRKKLLKKGLAAVLILTMAFSITACGSDPSSGSETTELVIAHTVGPTNAYVVGLGYCYDEYDKIGDGTITFNEQGAGVLGNERTITEGILMGDIDVGVISDMLVGSFYNELWFANMPGVFATYEEVEENYRSGWGYDVIRKNLEDNDLVLLGIFNSGFRWLSNNKNEITESKDIKGLKIRVPEAEYLVDIYKQLGALPTTIANNELASALQQGVADAQELGPQSAYNNGVYEFQKYWTETNAGYSGAFVIMNKEKFESLSTQQQEDLIAAFSEGADQQYEYSKKYTYECMDKMKEAGCIYSKPSQELTDRFYEIGKELTFKKPYIDYFGEELANKMYPEN